jgi:hypothetical protein
MEREALDLFTKPTLADSLRESERAIEFEMDVLDDRMDRVGLAFAKFHAENPEVMERLVAMARKYREAGISRGIGYFFEVMRHERIMASRDAQGFKLNNNFRSRYARLIERKCPDLVGFFRKRRLTARGAGVVEREA